MAPDRRKSSFTAALAGVALGLSLGVAPGALAQQIERSQQHDFRVRTLASGLEHPWSLAFLPGGGILITERPGRLRLFKDGQLEADPIAGVPEVVARGQGGLLDVALHPDVAENGWIYLSYAGAGENGAGTEVARARFDGAALSRSEEHTSELQSLMRISYAVFCLKKKTHLTILTRQTTN